MGVRIIEDREDGYAVLYCSTTMLAFGPVFTDREDAEEFLAWYGSGPDLRLLTNIVLRDHVSRFRVWKQTQKRWRIVNTKSGLDLGVYDGANEEEALDALDDDGGWSGDENEIGDRTNLRVTEERP